MVSVDELRKRASELKAKLATVAAQSKMPAPSADLEAEQKIVAAHLADQEARRRVSAAVSAELATLEEEIARAEDEAKRQRIAELNQQLADGRAEMIRRLQAVVDQAGHLHQVESTMYSLKRTPYHPTWPTFQQQIGNATFSNLNVELKR